MKQESIEQLLKEFEERQKQIKGNTGTRKFYDNQDIDDIYDVDIHIWRHKGMGNSLQTIVGNKLSILAATASYLNTLIERKVIDEKELEDLINFAKLKL